MEPKKIANDNNIIAQTKQWVADVIIELNFCPFAKKVFDQQGIFYKVVESKNTEEGLAVLIDECIRLNNDTDIETALIIYSNMLEDFNDYLDFLDYIGVYQLASFHPEYCFDGVELDAAENYTNRSPYPMLHLIKESSLAKALEAYHDPEQIPVRNVERAKQKGVTFFKQILNKISNIK